MKRRGFTLIELLVVIAIIGILAAMLFPVFARARESARKIQCLANVKNIAMAINMYTTDWDKLWPKEKSGAWGGCWWVADRANPYTEPPVVLDEYIKNRQIWQCPSSPFSSGPTVIPGGPNWLEIMNTSGGSLYVDPNGGAYDGCVAWEWLYPYPSGWGGDITDSYLQGRLPTESRAGRVQSADKKVFTQSIAVNIADDRHEMNMSSVPDASNYVICGDNGITPQSMTLGQTAYPSACFAECPQNSATCQPDPCSLDMIVTDADLKDPDKMKKGTRHLGGVNLGYLDGHAQWWASANLVSKFAEQAVYPSPLSHDATAYAMGLQMFGPNSKFKPAAEGVPMLW